MPVNGNRGDPPTDYDGSSRCYLTGNVAGDSDMDTARTVLTSPLFDLGGGGEITYAYWLDDWTTSLGRDALLVEAATDVAGADWRQVRRYDAPLPAWRTDVIRVGNDVPASATLRIRFAVSDFNPGAVVEGGLDAVEVRRLVPCGCPGDLDGDGVVGLADLTILLANFGTPGGANPGDGDLDGDGDVDLTDLTLFLAAFGNACS